MAQEFTKTQFWVMTCICYLGLFLEGIVDNAKSITVPDMKEAFNANYTEFGVLNSIASISYVVCCVVATFLFPRITFKWTNILGYVTCVFGSIGVTFSGSFIWIIITMFFSTCFLGFADCTYTTVGTMIFTEHTATFMCIMNFFYGLGAILGPTLVTFVYSHFETRFRAFYFFTSITFGILALTQCFIPFAAKCPPKQEETINNKPKITVARSYIDPMVWLFSFTLMSLTQVERGAMMWGGLYLKDVLHLDPEVEGYWFNTLFYILFTVGRFIGGFIADRIGLVLFTYCIIIGCMIFLIIGFCLGTVGIWVLSITGLFAGLFWPTIMCLVMKYYGDLAPIPASVVLPITFILLSILQVILGLLNNYIGPEWAYRGSIFFLVIALCLVTVIRQCLHNKEKKEQLEQPLINTEQKQIVV
ncbi:hypothetical protein WA158_002358 [Blastocystis sp. Blastoise]